MLHQSHRSVLTAGILAAVVCTRGLTLKCSAEGKNTIGVGPVKPTPALTQDMEQQGKRLALARVTESMDGHITDALVQMRKFQVVARSDLSDVFKIGAEGDTGAFDPATIPAAARLKLPKYLVVTTVDSFLEQNSEATFRTGKMTKRRFQISAQAKIYDTETAEILDSTNLQVERVEVLDALPGGKTDGKRTDEMMPLLARELAEKVALRTADVLFPEKIIDVDDDMVTINRGDLFGIAVGDVREVYGATRRITDPDSGDVIERKGKRCGRVRVTEIEPTYCQAEIEEERREGAITAGCVTKPAR